MIMIRTIRHSLKQLFYQPTRCFAKEASPKKGKQEEPEPEVPQQPTTEELLIKWLAPNHPSLSSAELDHYRNGFDDLSDSDKEILQDLAQKILEQPSAIFYQIAYHHNSLGTTGDLLFTTADEIPAEEVPERVRRVRKIA